MDVIIIIFLILLLISVLFFAFRLIKWILIDKMRSKVFCALLIVGSIGAGIHHFFFKNMQFLQSEVYSHLYLVKYPEKEQELLHQAIREKVEQHLKKGISVGKKLAYQNENSIFFYEYYKAFPLSVFQDEGTAYFLENEEDLGGLVTEELGMYSKYKLAEFSFLPCKDDLTLNCGELKYFNENGFIKSDRIFKFSSLN